MAVIKIEMKGGTATPGPPLGPALAGAGRFLNIRDVCTQINSLTEKKKGQTVRVIVDVDEVNKSYQLIIKETPAAILIKQAAGIAKGSSVPNRDKVATLTEADLAKIALAKQQDLNAFTPEAAIRILSGTARSMGVTITKS